MSNNLVDVKYWKTKVWKFGGDIDSARQKMNSWVDKNVSKYQFVEVFVNNAFAVEYKELINI